MTGLAALAVEVLWSRAMIPWVGGTALSQITTVAIYMAGLFIGSALAVGRLATVADPRRAFFLLELGAGVLSLLAVIGMPVADPLFAMFSRGELLGSGLGSVLRGLTGAALMIPATILMGLSFPFAIAAFERSQGGRGNAALAYGVNTIGATLGTLIGGFVLVPMLGVANGAWAVVIVDLVVVAGLMQLPAPSAYSKSALPASAASTPAPSRTAPTVAAREPSDWPMLLSIFIGGMVSLGLQAVLFRVLGLLLGPTARAFTLVLAVYVGGLGIGSLLVKPLVERGQRTASWIYLLCWMVVSGWGLLFSGRIEWLTGQVEALRPDGVFDLGAQLRLRAWIAAMVLLPITCAFGASYSAAVAAAPRGDARRASRLYASLTLGNIVGLAVVAWGVLPNFRLDRALLLVLAGALITPLPALLQLPIGATLRLALAGSGAGAALLVWLLMPGWPIRVLHTAAYVPAYGDSTTRKSNKVVRFHRSAFETSVTVVQVGEHRFLQLDGKTTGSTDGFDQATQGMLGAIPAALHPGARSAFVIGLGTGHTPAEVLRHPLERVDCAEISPEVVDTMPLFAAINRRCDLDPRFRMLEADGRTVLRYGGEQYDLVISEPSNVWIPGVAHLFTAESFRDVANCLEPEHGLCVQWVQGYGLEIETLKTIVRTFLDVFPHASLWFSAFGEPDLFLVGSQKPLALDFAALEARLAAVPVPNANFGDRPYDAVALLRHFVAGAESLRRFVGDGPRTTDARPSLEYAAEAALMGNQASPGATLIAALTEPPFALFSRGADGRPALTPAQTARLERSVAANRELAARLLDSERAAALLRPAGVDACEQMVRRYPDDDELRWSIAKLLMFGLSLELHGERKNEVMGLMAKVARFAPDHPESLKFAALAKLGDRTATAEVLALVDRHAAASAPWKQAPKVDKARMLFALGLVSESVALLEQVVAVDPWYLSAWSELETQAKAAGKPNLAARAHRRIEELGDDGRSLESQRRLEAEMQVIDAARAAERAPRAGQ